MRCTLITLILIQCLTLPAQDSLSNDQAMNRIQLMHDTLAFHHQFAQNDAGRQALAAGFEKAMQLVRRRQSPDSLGLQDFIIAVDEIRKPMQCGHTQLYIIRDTAYQRRYANKRNAFALVETSDKAYRLRDTLRTAKTLLPPGTQITELQSHPVADLVTALAPLRGLNDAGYDSAQLAYAALGISYFYGSRYGWQDTFQLHYLLPGNTQSQTARFATSRPDTTQAGEAGPILNKRQRRRSRYLSNWSFGPSDQDSQVYVMSLRSFNSENYRSAGYRKLLRKAFRQLQREGIDDLIIDLRWNGGGSLLDAAHLGTYLTKAPFTLAEAAHSESPHGGGKMLWTKLGMWVYGVRKRDGKFVRRGLVKLRKPHRHAYQGDLAILLDEFSFSATSLLAHSLASNGSASTYGRRTGAGQNITYGGTIKSFTLGPEGEQQFRLIIPNWAIIPVNPQPGTITPKIIVPRTLESLVGQSDETLLRAIEGLRADN